MINHDKMIKRILFLNSLMFLFICASLIISSCGEAKSFPLVSGHRGGMGIAPENTLAAADSCIKYKISYMECDVCISKDSVFYILHDSTLDRTTNGCGNIKEWNSIDIDTLDAGSWFGEAFKGQRVPRLVDVLRRAKGNDLKITIDYRNGDIRKLLDLVESEDMWENCCFAFHSEEVAKQFINLAPNAKSLQVYMYDEESLDRLATKLKPGIAVININVLTPELMKKCKAYNMRVLALVLGAGNKTKEYEKAIKLGVDIVATDYPQDFVKKYIYKSK